MYQIKKNIALKFLLISFIIVIVGIFFVLYNSNKHKEQDLKEGSLEYYDSIGYLPADKVEEYIEKYQSIYEHSYLKVNNQDFIFERLETQIETKTIILFPDFSVHPYILSLTFSEDLSELITVHIIPAMYNEYNEEIDFSDGINITPFDTIDYITIDHAEFIKVKSKVKNYEIDLQFNIDEMIGRGTTTLEFKNDEAYLNGELGTSSYIQIKYMLKNYPNVNTLVLEYVPGSVNDNINVHTGRLIRNNNITTIVKDYSEVFSGGVDLFASGKERIVTDGATIGVHSWCCVGEIPADKLSKKDEAHRSQIEYFTEMLGDKKGYDFYFFTLQAASFENIYQMSIEEIMDYNLATQFDEGEGIEFSYYENYISIGNPDANNTILFVQGGPFPTLDTESLSYAFQNVDLQNYQVVSVHQFQTKYPEKISDREITFEEAKQYSTQTVNLLHDVITEFKEKKKNIYLTGASFGAFILQEYISTYNTDAIKGIGILVGRINLEEEFWQGFVDNKPKVFEDGVNIIEAKNLDEAGMGGDNKFQQINIPKIAAGMAYKNFKEELKDKDLTNVIYVYGTKDRQMGRLRDDEIEFLTRKKVEVIKNEGGHMETALAYFNIVIAKITQDNASVRSLSFDTDN